MLRPHDLPMVSNDNSTVASAFAAAPKSACSRVLRLVLLGVLCGVIAGCGGHEVYPVEGTVVYSDGSPATDLEDYVVAFELADVEGTSDQPRVSASGTVKADGTFTVGTYEPDDGAVPGKHRVALSAPVVANDQDVVKEVIDPKFYSFKTSGLEATITPGTNEVKLTVERRK